jgi:hypothetical protein
MAPTSVLTRGIHTPLAPVRPPSHSLRNSAIPDPNAGTDQTWVEGFSFTPRGCGTGEVIAVCPPSPHTKAIDPFPETVTVIPWGVHASISCSTLGGLDLIEARAAENLDSVLDYNLEREFWRGDLAQANSYPTNFLANSASLEDLSPGGSDASPGAYALAALQEYLAGCHGGGQGMIHAPRTVVTMWFSQTPGLEKVGNLIMDPYGNLIVAGVGYDGSDPDGELDDTGETAWAYATSLVEVKIGALLPLGRDDNMSAVNRSTNLATFRAERPVAAFWDGCCHAGIRVGVCATCCTPEA